MLYQLSPHWLTYLLHWSHLSKIWALCVSWIIFRQLHYALSIALWKLFCWLVPAIFNHTSCTQVHEWQQSHFVENPHGTLFSWFPVYYVDLSFWRCEYFVRHGSLITIFFLLWDLFFFLIPVKYSPIRYPVDLFSEYSRKIFDLLNTFRSFTLLQNKWTAATTEIFSGNLVWLVLCHLD